LDEVVRESTSLEQDTQYYDNEILKLQREKIRVKTLEKTDANFYALELAKNISIQELDEKIELCKNKKAIVQMNEVFYHNQHLLKWSRLLRVGGFFSSKLKNEYEKLQDEIRKELTEQAAYKADFFNTVTSHKERDITKSSYHRGILGRGHYNQSNPVKPYPYEPQDYQALFDRLIPKAAKHDGEELTCASSRVLLAKL